MKEPYVPCRTCGGTGIQPFSRFACLGCGGKGVQSIEGPVETCPVCEGSGTDGFYLHCLRCHGKGLVAAKTAGGREA